MQYFDLIGQSLLLLGFAVAVPLGWVFDGELMLSILTAQLLIGLWQMISAVVSILGNAPYSKQKQLHFITAILYIILLAIIGNFESELPQALLAVVFIGPAWIMAGWYYYITWRWVFQKRSAGKFLPHVFI